MKTKKKIKPEKLPNFAKIFELQDYNSIKTKLNPTEQTYKNAYHLSVLNSEMGDLRDTQKDMSEKLNTVHSNIDTLNISVSTLTTSMTGISKSVDELHKQFIPISEKVITQANDLGWIKKIGYFLAASVVPLLVKVAFDILKAHSK